MRTAIAVTAGAPGGNELVDALCALAVRGLPQMRVPQTDGFAQTVRGVATAAGPRIVREGTNLRYAAIVALGLGRLPVSTQEQVLGGATAEAYASVISHQAGEASDPGEIALAAWASAEVGGQAAQALLGRLKGMLETHEALAIVDLAWMLTAALASPDASESDAIRSLVRPRLLRAQGPAGLFPHVDPARALGRVRAHVGCFADQVYPIQALARLARADGDHEALAAANACAAQICELQGADGQWWWHYDARNGSVVERYPVYSVHQHAMAPMALRDLMECGGQDHTTEIWNGLGWLTSHPEVFPELIDELHDVVWRKVGRREPRKAARRLAAVTTSIHPALHLPGVDRAMPPNRIDHECRPYELGWLLYAWNTSPVSLAGSPAAAEEARSRG